MAYYSGGIVIFFLSCMVIGARHSDHEHSQFLSWEREIWTILSYHMLDGVASMLLVFYIEAHWYDSLISVSHLKNWLCSWSECLAGKAIENLLFKWPRTSRDMSDVHRKPTRFYKILNNFNKILWPYVLGIRITSIVNFWAEREKSGVSYQCDSW